MDHKVEVEAADLLKIYDALNSAGRYFRKRDEMNGAIHLAAEVRYAPLTSVIESARERCEGILDPIFEAAGERLDKGIIDTS